MIVTELVRRVQRGWGDLLGTTLASRALTFDRPKAGGKEVLGRRTWGSETRG